MATAAVDGTFVDTNVWVYASVPSAPDHELALKVLARIAPGQAWTSRQVLREFLAVMSRPQAFFVGDAPMADLVQRARIIESGCRVAEDGPAVTEQLMALLSTGKTRRKQVHDANIVATMLAHGVRKIVTGNVDDFARWGDAIEILPLRR